MVVDPVDRERIDVAARGMENDERPFLILERAIEAEDVRERHFGDTSPADPRYSRSANLFEGDRFSIGPDDLVDRRARDGKMLIADRDRERGNDGQRQRNAKRHPRTLARAAVDFD